MLSISDSSGGPVKTQTADPDHVVSDAVGLGQGLVICISNEFPGDAVATDLGTTLQELVPSEFVYK